MVGVDLSAAMFAVNSVGQPNIGHHRGHCTRYPDNITTAGAACAGCNVQFATGTTLWCSPSVTDELGAYIQPARAMTVIIASISALTDDCSGRTWRAYADRDRSSSPSAA